MSLFCSSYLQLSNRDRYSSYSQKQLLGDTSPQTDCLSAADCETSHNIKEQSGTDRICLPQNDGNVTQNPCEWTLAGVFLVLLSWRAIYGSRRASQPIMVAATQERRNKRNTHKKEDVWHTQRCHLIST